MRFKFMIGCLAIMAGFMIANPASASIAVSFDPNPQNVFINDVFTMDIVADIPTADAIIGWGLDLTIDDGTIVSLTNVAINNVVFDPAVSNPDGDGLAALVPFADVPLSGNDIVLVTLTFLATNIGSTDLFLSDDHLTDTTEGFKLDPPGGFADVVYSTGTINVAIPEPATLALLGLGVIGSPSPAAAADAVAANNPVASTAATAPRARCNLPGPVLPIHSRIQPPP